MNLQQHQFPFTLTVLVCNHRLPSLFCKHGKKNDWYMHADFILSRTTGCIFQRAASVTIINLCLRRYIYDCNHCVCTCMIISRTLSKYPYYLSITQIYPSHINIYHVLPITSEEPINDYYIASLQCGVTVTLTLAVVSTYINHLTMVTLWNTAGHLIWRMITYISIWIWGNMLSWTCSWQYRPRPRWLYITDFILPQMDEFIIHISHARICWCLMHP